LPSRELRRCFPRLVRAALHHRPAVPLRSAEDASLDDDPLTALLDKESRAGLSDRLTDLLDCPEVRAALEGLSPIYWETLETLMLPAEDVAAERGMNVEAIYKRRSRLLKVLAPVLRERRSLVRQPRRHREREQQHDCSPGHGPSSPQAPCRVTPRGNSGARGGLVAKGSSVGRVHGARSERQGLMSRRLVPRPR
jgi:hypothetical protein